MPVIFETVPMPTSVAAAQSAFRSGAAAKWRWEPVARIDGAWGLCPLEWLALEVALRGSCGDPFPTQVPPYSDEGVSAMRQLSRSMVRFLDDDVATFRALLTGATHGWAPMYAENEDEDGDIRSVESVAADLQMLGEWIELHRVADRVNYARHALDAFRAACAIATASNSLLRQRFVPQPRPISAPIRWQTSGVEGFDTFERASIEGGDVDVLFSSGWQYRIPGSFVSEVERGAPLTSVECISDGAALRFYFANGEESDLSGPYLLRVCEPLYEEFGMMMPWRRAIVERWLATRSFRISPPT
jgi:hypothetical protein